MRSGGIVMRIYSRQRKWRIKTSYCVTLMTQWIDSEFRDHIRPKKLGDLSFSKVRITMTKLEDPLRKETRKEREKIPRYAGAMFHIKGG